MHGLGGFWVEIEGYLLALAILAAFFLFLRAGPMIPCTSLRMSDQVGGSRGHGMAFLCSYLQTFVLCSYKERGHSIQLRLNKSDGSAAASETCL